MLEVVINGRLFVGLFWTWNCVIMLRLQWCPSPFYYTDLEVLGSALLLKVCCLTIQPNWANSKLETGMLIFSVVIASS